LQSWIPGFVLILKTISQILTAGIAIIAFALLLYALTFNLRDRVARAFSTIMICLVIVFSMESFGGTSHDPVMVNLWLRLQWVGIILLPASYLHFSDALLATTGQPSRWRRKWAVRLTYSFSVVLIALVFTPWFLGDLILDQPPAPHFTPTLLTELFTFYYLVILVLAWINFVRAFNRTLTPTSKRRMLYLIVSAIGPALGSFPYLLYGSAFANDQPIVFWGITILVNVGLSGLIFVMAYAVAFFGVPWPDRVVKSRLIKWALRGPATASVALGLTTLVKRGGEAFGTPYSAFIPIVMVVTILILEYAITLFYPYLERWLLFGRDERDLDMIRSLEQRIITRGDLKQFIEMILAAVTDRMRAKGAYLLAVTDEEIELVDKAGRVTLHEQLLDEIDEFVPTLDPTQEAVTLNHHLIIPLWKPANGGAQTLLGLMGLVDIDNPVLMEAEEIDSLKRLTSRATIALRDREMLEEVFDLLEKMNPQEELIQHLRAAGRFDRQGILQDEDASEKKEMVQWVRDALTHYWGGPKLTENPLIKLKIVQEALAVHEGSQVNALRAVLKSAIEQARPEGERRYTGEWILYNILDLKFLEGKKMREIALKLAVSEADLYRKQRVAIEMIANILVQMELKSSNNNTN
jgi:hypothetical protein